MSSDLSSDPIFVISIGRSGSTLIQRLLNCSPLLTIWGEHGGYLEGFANAFFHIQDSEHNTYNMNLGYRKRDLVIGELAAPGLSIPWIQPIAASDLFHIHRDLLRSIFCTSLPKGIRWGFKEIKYGKRVMRYLISLFPRARFVINGRDPRDYIFSRIRAWGPEFDLMSKTSRDQAMNCIDGLYVGWIQTHKEFVEFIDEHPYACFEAPFGELTGSSDFAERLFDFLRTDLPRKELVKDVLGHRPDSSNLHCKPTWRESEARSNLKSLVHELLDDQCAANPLVSRFS